MKNLFTLLTLCISLQCALAQWQLGNSPSIDNHFKRGLERVGDEIWIGTLEGTGLYRSADGHSWTQATFFPTSLNIYDIYAESPLSVLLLTCDWDNGGLPAVYRLQKNGNDWTTTARFSLPSCSSDLGTVIKVGDRIIVFNPSWNTLVGINPDSTLAFNVDAHRFAYNAGTLVRSYGSDVWSSSDGGTSWTNVYQTTQVVNAVYADPTYFWMAQKNNTIVRKNRTTGQLLNYTPTLLQMNLNDSYLRFGSLGDTLTLSTNFAWMYSMNAGQSWQLICDFENPGIQGFDVIEQFPEWPVAYGVGNDMIRSDDNGASWYIINTGIGAYSVLALAKNGLETALFAGVDNAAHPLYRSLNNGQSWQTVTTPFTGHQFNGMQSMGAESMFVLENNDLYFTPDIGANWSQLADSADFPAKKLDGYFWKVYAQGDNAIRRYNVDGTYEATLLPSPVGPGNPICDFSPWAGEWYLLMQNGDFYFSTDDGLSWTFRSHPFFGENPLRLTRINNNLVWWSADHVLYSNDQGTTWLPADFPGYSGSLLKDVTASNAAGCFAALYGMGVFGSVDDGATWTSMNDALYNPNIYALALVNDSKIFAGSHHGGIWNAAIPSIVLRGQVYDDANQNNSFDNGEKPVANAIMKAMPSGQLSTTDPSGVFTFPFAPGQNDFISLAGLDVSGATVNPPVTAISQPVSNLKFAISNLPQTDLQIDAASLQSFKTGQNNFFHLQYRNKGTLEASGIILQCTLPDGVNWTGATPTPDQVNGKTLRWLPAPLAAGAVQEIVLSLSVNANVPAGAALEFVSSVQSAANDADPSDNEDHVLATVLEPDAADPVKEVDRGILTLSEIAEGTPLEFTLRFQNTGATDAHLLVITDLMDPSLDLATLQLLSSSHPCAWKITGTNKLIVTFPHLDLPPGTDDPEASRGFVRFAVKARPGVVLNTLITNQAMLAFDYGQPFQSNTTQTKVQIFNPGDPLLNHGLPMGARPNPAVYYLIADWNFQADAPGRLKMTDMSGVVWVDLPVVPGQYDAQFDVVDLPNGAYVLFVDAGSRHFVRTVVVAHPDSNRRN